MEGTTTTLVLPGGVGTIAERTTAAALAASGLNRLTLEAREKGKFKDEEWYRFGRSQGFATVPRPKVLVPAMLRAPEAIVDAKGELAFTASGKGGGGAWALVPKGGVTLEELAALVRSPAAWDHIRVYGSPQQLR